MKYPIVDFNSTKRYNPLMNKTPDSTPIFPKPTTGNPELDDKLTSWGIKLGVSVEDTDLARQGKSIHISISSFPHVFHCQTLILREQHEEIALINSAMVMMGHGVALDGNNENWKFLGTNQKVSDTVSVYEKIAKQLGWPHLDVLLVCRRDLKKESIQKARMVFESHGIPYIFGDDTVNISCSDSREGKTSGIYKHPEGVQLIIADTGKWDRLKLREWQNYWMYRLIIEDIRKIPAWAKYPADL